MEKVVIRVNNSKSQVFGTRKLIIWLNGKMKLRPKGYFWSKPYREGRWDGYINYLSEVNGIFSTGLLNQVVYWLKQKGVKIKIEDKRPTFKPLYKVGELGGLKLRKDQLEAVGAFINNKLHGIPFRRGIMAEATNTGKSLIAAGIYASFSDKRTGIFLVNSKDLFEQAYNDLNKFFPKEIGRVNSKYFEWKRINVCMVQTLGIRLNKFPEYRNKIARTDIVVVDEADLLIGRKDVKYILSLSHNAPVRVALTGTALKHKGTAKGKEYEHGGNTRNQEQLSFFGPIIHRRTNRENIDEGISDELHVEIIPGNIKVLDNVKYQEEYDRRISRNIPRNEKVWERVKFHSKKGRLPLVILFRHHKHGRNIFKRVPDRIKSRYKIKMVTGEDKGRQFIIDDFNAGKIDILLASMILQRGLNLNSMRALINAAGGDSESVVIQICGRVIRKTIKGKRTDVYLDDFWDKGKYLQKHSLHRLKAYKKEKFKVTESYK